MKKIILTFLVVFATFFGTQSFANNYYIENYNVDITVTESKVAKVTETIDVVFTEPSSGITRTIPVTEGLLGKINVPDEYIKVYLNDKRLSKDQTEYKKAQCSGTGKKRKCSRKLPYFIGKGDYTVKIGSSKELQTGAHRYIIQYPYIFKDRNNAFSLDLIPTNMNTHIQNGQFSITFPKQFDPKDVILSVGAIQNGRYTERSEIQITNNTLSGQLTTQLRPYEGVHISANFPNAFFFKLADKKLCSQIIYTALIIMSLISIGLWYVFGKEKKVVITETAEPPLNMTPAEVLLIYSNRHATNTTEIDTTKGAVATILQLANKGFIQLKQEPKDLIFIKLKDYTGKNQAEQIIMDALFKEKTELGYKELSRNERLCEKCNLAVKASLGDQSAGTIELAATDMRKPRNLEEQITMAGTAFSMAQAGAHAYLNSEYQLLTMMYEKTSRDLDKDKGPIALVQKLMLWIFCAIGYFTASDFHLSALEPTITVLGVILSLSSITAGFFAFKLAGQQHNRFMVLIPLGFGFIFFLCSAFAMTNSLKNIDLILVVYGALILCSICFGNITRLTEYGRAVVGQVLGFERYLKNPNSQLIGADYIYKILPYACVVNADKNLIEKGYSLITYAPQWYTGNTFNSTVLSNIVEGLKEALTIANSDSRTAQKARRRQFRQR